VATTKTTTTRTSHGERHHRRLREQPVIFLGLYLAPLPALLTAWLIHAYVVGVSWGPVQLSGNMPALVVVSCLLSVGAVGLGAVAWHFAEHRKPAMRWLLVASTSALGFLFAVNVGVGPHRWWSGGFVLMGWFVATAWGLARLNVTRQDPREPAEPEEPGFLKKLTGWRTRSVTTEVDHTGEPLRTDIEFQHAPGDVTRTLQDAVPNIESYAAAPSGLSRAVGTDRSDRSRLSVMHKDPLAGLIPLGPPSHPGQSVAEPCTFAIYDTGHPVWCHLFGGRGFNPTGYGFMGVTRSGKTVAENLMLTDAVITRNDGVILYLNKAKGMQDARPIFPGIEVAVLTTHIQDYVSALNQVVKIMDYRQRQLSAYGISAWSARKCFHNPPQRKANGDPEPMEPMPALDVHVGEADAVYDNPKASELADYIASKGLSLGVILGNSLQRATADKMPSNLRFNVSAWWCFGTGDPYSADFALSDRTLEAIPESGRPHNWKASRPGNHFFEGPGVDDTLWPVRAKTQMLAPGTSPDAPQDVIDSALQEALLDRCRGFAPQMARLDRGSAEATGDPDAPQTWWDLARAETVRIRNSLIGGTADMAASTPNTWIDTRGAPPAKPVAIVPGDPQTEDADWDSADAVTAEIEEVREVDGVQLYPADEDGTTAESYDLESPLPPGSDDEISWEDPRPAPRSRTDALLAFHAALRELIEIPELRDPRDPDGNTVIVTAGEIVDRYPFRSRPWFSEILSEMAEGAVTPPPSMSLARADDYPPHEGRYRLRRLPDDHAE
jgi:hypothetical protein